MFHLLSRTINTATRFDTWDAPDHWRAQARGYRNDRARNEADRVRLRGAPKRGDLR